MTNSTHCPPGKQIFGTQYAAVVRALQQVVLLPQKFAPTSWQGLVEPCCASWNSVQTHGTLVS
jgi:hypothetical protein